MDVYGQLDNLLGKIYGHTMSAEQSYVAESEFRDISVNDMHIIAAVGMKTSGSMSSIAKKMGVTVGTLTTAINSLVKKGYVNRTRSSKDRRVVLISLSEKGERAFLYQRGFHDKLRAFFKSELSAGECSQLVMALSKIEDRFLNQS